MMKIICADDLYWLKVDESVNIDTIIKKIKKNSGMRKDSFADKCVINIISNLLSGAVDLGNKYRKYYIEEYESFSEFLYKKELMEKDFINEIQLEKSETLWKLRYSTNNYSVKEIVGYENENLEVINQTLESII